MNFRKVIKRAEKVTCHLTTGDKFMSFHEFLSFQKDEC